MYDAIEERMAAYEKEILRKLEELESGQRQEQAAPPLKNTNKAKLIKNRGQEPMRQALYRMSGVDATCETNCFSVGKRLRSGPYSLRTTSMVSTPIASICVST